MVQPQGPGSGYQLLFSDDTANGFGLPDSFRAIYPGDWFLKPANGRPYIYSNFAQSRDGRVSYNAPGVSSGGDVTNFSRHDRWLMGLLRTRADAVMMGDNTVKIEPDHIWNAAHIFPDDAPAYAELRRLEERRPEPFLVILSYDGNLGYNQAPFHDASQHIILATTASGAAQAKDVQCAAQLDVHTLGTESVDMNKMVEMLAHDYGVESLLCEGGPRVMGGMLNAGLIDEEFVTLCPSFIGRNNDAFRPSYIEGVTWLPHTAPYSKPLSLHRAGDYLFMRTRCSYRS